MLVQHQMPQIELALHAHCWIVRVLRRIFHKVRRVWALAVRGVPELRVATRIFVLNGLQPIIVLDTQQGRNHVGVPPQLNLGLEFFIYDPEERQRLQNAYLGIPVTEDDPRNVGQEITVPWVPPRNSRLVTVDCVRVMSPNCKRTQNVVHQLGYVDWTVVSILAKYNYTRPEQIRKWYMTQQVVWVTSHPYVRQLTEDYLLGLSCISLQHWQTFGAGPPPEDLISVGS
jgi:hypothetical protein